MKSKKIICLLFVLILSLCIYAVETRDTSTFQIESTLKHYSYYATPTKNSVRKLENYSREDISNDYFRLNLNANEGWMEIKKGQMYELVEIDNQGTKWNPEKCDIKIIGYLELNDPELYESQLKCFDYLDSPVVCTHLEISSDTWLYVCSDQTGCSMVEFMENRGFYSNDAFIQYCINKKLTPITKRIVTKSNSIMWDLGLNYVNVNI